jgi:hypothetical protein
VIEDAIKARLLAAPTVTALVDTRVYDELPQNPVLPTVTLLRIDDDTEMPLDEPGDLVHARIQADSWATSHASARALALNVKKALGGCKGTLAGTEIRGVKVGSSRSLRDPDDEKLKRVSQDFFVWGKE